MKIKGGSEKRPVGLFVIVQCPWFGGSWEKVNFEHWDYGRRKVPGRLEVWTLGIVSRVLLICLRQWGRSCTGSG